MNPLTIAISSGKGGTGKTFITTNIARALEKSGQPVRYIDCDVEEPNGHLFLTPDIREDRAISLMSPSGVDPDKCTACGKCQDACQYNAINIINGKVLFFRNMCHVCGACTRVCPEDAIVEKDRIIGRALQGQSGHIDVHYALLQTAEGGMSPRLIKEMKNNIGPGINLLDSPPGTSCPVVETVKESDLCVLVTDPTPFGIHDLKLAVDMCRGLGREPVVMVNRAEYLNDDLFDYCRQASLEIIGEIPDDRTIAESYSEGRLAVDDSPEYLKLFTALAEKIIARAQSPKPPKKKIAPPAPESLPDETLPYMTRQFDDAQTREIVVISGKGGTGKTSLTAAFCALEKKIALADCDVDASDLHLVLSPEIKERGLFSGGNLATLHEEACTQCGACQQACQFDAVTEEDGKYRIDPMACEGCGVCALVCPAKAVSLAPAINGEWYLSKTRFGPMAHAKLGIAEENSGKLVTLVRQKKDEAAQKAGLTDALIDGSPGTGCPVIASLTGAHYAVIVTEPTVSGVHDLKRIVDVVQFFKIPGGVVVNKWDLNPGKTEEIEALAGEKGIAFLGKIPYDSQITQAQVQGVSIVEFTDDDITEKVSQIWDAIKREALQ